MKVCRTPVDSLFSFVDDLSSNILSENFKMENFYCFQFQGIHVVYKIFSHVNSVQLFQSLGVHRTQGNSLFMYIDDLSSIILSENFRMGNFHCFEGTLVVYKISLFCLRQ